MRKAREQLQLLERRFGLLNAACCDECCGEQVSMVQSHILFEVRRLRNPSMQRVAEELGIDITTFSRQIKTLEVKGLVMKQGSPTDKRVNLLGLTNEGDQVLEKIDRFMSARIEQVFSCMTPFEQEAVINSLSLLNAALTRSSGQNYIACCK